MSAASKSPNVMKIENGSQGRLTQISRFSYQNNDICDQNLEKRTKSTILCDINYVSSWSSCKLKNEKDSS